MNPGLLPKRSRPTQAIGLLDLPREILDLIVDLLRQPKDLATFRGANAKTRLLVDTDTSGALDESGKRYRKVFARFFQEKLKADPSFLFTHPFWVRVGSGPRYRQSERFSDQTKPAVLKGYLAAAVPLYEKAFTDLIDCYNRNRGWTQSFHDTELYHSLGRFNAWTPPAIAEAFFKTLTKLNNPERRRCLMSSIVDHFEDPIWLGSAEKFVQPIIDDDNDRKSILGEIFVKADQTVQDRIIQNDGFSAEDIGAARVVHLGNDTFRDNLLTSITCDRFPEAECRLFLLRKLAHFPKQRLRIAKDYLNSEELLPKHHRTDLRETLLGFNDAKVKRAIAAVAGHEAGSSRRRTISALSLQQHRTALVEHQQQGVSGNNHTQRSPRT